MYLVRGQVVKWSFGHLVIFIFTFGHLLTIIININIYIIVADFDNPKTILTK